MAVIRFSNSEKLQLAWKITLQGLIYCGKCESLVKSHKIYYMKNKRDFTIFDIFRNRFYSFFVVSLLVIKQFIFKIASSEVVEQKYSCYAVSVIYNVFLVVELSCILMTLCKNFSADIRHNK